VDVTAQPPVRIGLGSATVAAAGDPEVARGRPAATTSAPAAAAALIDVMEER
jgi:hypothetical protein